MTNQSTKDRGIPDKSPKTDFTIPYLPSESIFKSKLPRCITVSERWVFKYMKSSASESIKNGYMNLERLSRSSRLAQPRISPLERL